MANGGPGLDNAGRTTFLEQNPGNALLKSSAAVAVVCVFCVLLVLDGGSLDDDSSSFSTVLNRDVVLSRRPLSLDEFGLS